MNVTTKRQSSVLWTVSLISFTVVCAALTLLINSSAGSDDTDSQSADGTDNRVADITATVENDSGYGFSSPGGQATAQPGSPEAILWDNGPLVTCPGCGAGGADASELQTALGMGTYGFGHQMDLGYWVADDFEVVDPAGWNVSNYTFFAYQTGSGTTSTLTDLNWRVYDGQPGAGGSVIASGSGLTGTDWTSSYRVLDTALTNPDRPIMYADAAATAGLHLDPGSYWLAWQIDGTLASGPWAPPVTIPGQTTTGNSLQSLNNGGTWAPLVDEGTSTAQGLPFIIRGNVPGGSAALRCNGPIVGFESGSFPVGWSFETNALPGGEWVVSANNSSAFWDPGPAPEGYFYASANDDLAGSGSDGSLDYLYTNIIDLSDNSSATLSFWYHFNAAFGHVAGGVEVSGDGGVTWDGEIIVPAAAVWQQYNLNLNAYAGNSNVQVRFHSDDGGAWAAGYGIDAVSLVCADGGPTPTPTSSPTPTPTPTHTPPAQLSGDSFLPYVLYQVSQFFDGPWEDEPNNTSADGNGPLRSAQNYFGYPDDQWDFYYVDSAGGQIDITLSNYSGSGGQLLLYYTTTANRVGQDTEAPYRILYTGPAGRYYIAVYTAGGFNSNTAYTLRATYP